MPGIHFQSKQGGLRSFVLIAVAGFALAGKLAAVYAVGEPPVNDDCPNAFDLGALPAMAIGDTTDATTDTAVLCGPFVDGPFHNVWYSVTGTGGTLTATVCSDNTMLADSKISVYCGACDLPVCVDGNDDDCATSNPSLSTVSWCSEVGQTYLISVGGAINVTPTGVFELSVSDAGDPCIGAVDCAGQTGACCFENDCIDTTTASGCPGQFYPGESCPGFVCPVCLCGDLVCDPACNENCETCPADCGCAPCTSCVAGVCTTDCGNGTCDPACENCETCPVDCACGPCTSCVGGTCTPDCGNGVCDPACENCETCPADCACGPCTSCVGGSCTTDCGNGTCDPACENCETCPVDCACAPCTSCVGGACTPDCGNGTCDPACENCETCPVDCACGPCTSCVGGTCTSDCGNGTCDPICENCSTCPADCGCEDGVACTIDACNAASGACEHTPDPVSCSDGDPCTDDVCDPLTGCQNPDNGLCGACCDASTGTCTITTQADCACAQCTFTAGTDCANVECHQITPPIPTTSEWGLLVLSLAFLIGLKLRFRHEVSCEVS